MSNYMVPTDDKFVEYVAKSIAKNRMQQDAANSVKDMYGLDMKILEPMLENTINSIFEALWNGASELDNRQKELYRQDARIAINAINLKLLTSIE